MTKWYTSRIWSHSNTYFGQHTQVLLNKFNNYEMPTINRKQIRPRQTTYKHDNQSAEYYNSSAWHSLRSTYYMNNPLCECCMAHDVVRSAEHVHHKRKFLSGVTEDERWSLLLEPNNLMSVCTKCHSKLHSKMKRYSLVMCDELTDKEYNDDSLSI